MCDESGTHFFEDLCSSAGVALIATDNQLRIQFWNPVAGRLFGGQAHAMLGEPIASIIPGDRRDLANRLFQRALDKGEVSEFEFPHRDPQGQPVFLAVTVSPIVDAERGRIGTSVCVRDVSRRMDLERRMANSEKMSALGAMAGAVAHHFNNFIGGVLTSIDFAQRSDDPTVLRRALRTTAEALTRANQITLSLLTFAEGDRGTTDISDISETVQRFVTQRQPRLAEKGIRLETDIQPVGARVSARRLETVLECLTTNACEAMPDGGTLRIGLARAGDGRTIVLRIADSGTGIPDGVLRQVFEPFYTTKNTPGAPGEHPGLGLAVVHGIVKDLGGTVTLASSPGEGTVCSVRIPG